MSMKETEHQPNPNYFAVIPANVRYDPELPPNAKLLYGEVTALCNKHGICWAENSYFAKLYDVDIRTIERWLGDLVKRKYIKTDIINGNRRHISLSDTPTKRSGGGDKNVGEPRQKDQGVTENHMPSSQSAIEVSVSESPPNNTSNNTSNKEINILSPLNPPKSALELIDHVCDMLPKITKPLSYLIQSGLTQIFLNYGGALAVEFVAKTQARHGKYGSYENLEELIKEWKTNGKSFESIALQTKNGNGGSGGSNWRRSRPRKKYLADEDKGKSWREKEAEKGWEETKRKYRDGELPPLEHPEGVVLSDEARKNWNWSLDDEIN